MTKPLLFAVATELDRKVNEATGQQTYGVFVDFLITFLPTLIQLLGLCKTPIPPAPPPVTPPTSPEMATAWQDAWKMKYRATSAFHEDTQDYDAHTLRSVARHAKREKRRDGQPIKAAEAIEIARQYLDSGRKSDLETITAGILESRS